MKKTIIVACLALLSAPCFANQDVNQYESLTASNISRYEVTQDKKYIRAAYKYSFEAINQGTKNINTIMTAINLAAADLNPDKMIKAYDYLCNIDPAQGQKEKENFIKKISEVREIKSKQAKLRYLQYANAIQNMETPQYPKYPTYRSTTTNCHQTYNGIQCDTSERGF